MIRSLVFLSTVWWCSAQLAYNGYSWALTSKPLLTTPKLQSYGNYDTTRNTRKTHIGPYTLVYNNYDNLVTAYNVSHSQNARSYSLRFTGNHNPAPHLGQYISSPSISYGVPEITSGSSHYTSPETQYIESPSLNYGIPEIQSEVNTFPPPSEYQYIDSTTISYDAIEVDTELSTVPSEDQYIESTTINDGATEMDSEVRTSPPENQGRDLSSANAALSEDVAVVDFSLEGKSYPTIYREAFGRKRRSATLPSSLYMTPADNFKEDTNSSVPSSTKRMTDYDPPAPSVTYRQPRPHYTYYHHQYPLPYVRNLFTNRYYRRAPKLVVFTGKSIYNPNSYSPKDKKS